MASVKHKEQAVKGTPHQAARKGRLPSCIRIDVNPVQEYEMMRELLETGECRNKADIALRQECTRAHVTQIFYLADLAPEVIDTLVNIETLPFRLSWRWMKEKLRHLPKEDQLAAVLKRGGYMLKALLKALHKKRRA